MKSSRLRVTIALLAAVLVIGTAGCGQRKAAKLQKEPQITLLLNAQTGEKKTMPVEEYVKGVVGGEMGKAAPGIGTPWPTNAYAAQAILARTFIMEYMDSHPGAEISTNIEQTQAYNAANVTPQIEEAVKNTRGEVIMQGNKYVKTFFHSYSGGQTATAAEGLNYKIKENYTESVKMPDNKYVPADKKNWTASLPLTQVSAALASKGISVGSITSMKVTQRGSSGRITEIAITGSGGTKTIHGADFRLAVGADKMLSTLVDDAGFNVAGGTLTMKGKGFGHGVGMSQWDAYMMAKDGKSPEDIIMAFFKNVQVEKRWD